MKDVPASGKAKKKHAAPEEEEGETFYDAMKVLHAYHASGCLWWPPRLLPRTAMAAYASHAACKSSS